jgi:hypothetical protein
MATVIRLIDPVSGVTFHLLAGGPFLPGTFRYLHFASDFTHRSGLKKLNLKELLAPIILPTSVPFKVHIHAFMS